MGLTGTNMDGRLMGLMETIAGDLREIRRTLERRSERGEFAEIIERLKQRGVITQEDVERVERDGTLSVQGSTVNAEGKEVRDA